MNASDTEALNQSSPDEPRQTALQSNVFDTALIFEGGGMRNSYTAPVVNELLSAGIYFDWVAGISAGSSHLLNYLSRDEKRSTTQFIELPADPRTGGLRSWVLGDGLFNSDFIYHQVAEPGAELPLDFETFQANPARYAIGSFRVDDGEMVYFGRDDLTDKATLISQVQASSSLPMLMPLVEMDGHTYADGALGPTGGIALDAARHAGFSKFVFVLTRPREYTKGPWRAERTANAYFRQFPTIAEALTLRPEKYNSTREEIRDLESAGQAYVFAPNGYTVVNTEKKIDRLTRSFSDGQEQIRQELPAIKEFLGL